MTPQTLPPNKDRGAAMVYLAVIMVALLGFIALAVDLSALYAQRRQLQNAADAAALAAAGQLCQGRPQAVQSTAQRFASANGVNDIRVRRHGWRVRVEATRTATTYFAQVMGFSQVTLRAQAEAACSVANEACGLWPLAVALPNWQALTQSGCGKVFYIAAREESAALDCRVHQCDLDGDGVDEIISGDAFAWLDFSSQTSSTSPRDPCLNPGSSAGELRCQLEMGSRTPLDAAACVEGVPGSRVSVGSSINARSGESVPIGLYDQRCSRNWRTARTRFHIVSFGCITVLGWERRLTIPCQEAHRAGRACRPLRVQAIAARIPCDATACFSTCGEITGAPPQAGSVNTVGLTR